LDYEEDSGDEWEEEPEDGEDLDSDKEIEDKEEEEKGGNEADDDDQDGWMVPHGYLSDEEGDAETHLDKDTLKSQEEEFYKELKRENKVGF
jgi:chromatin assembly factor 1 subunit A